MLTPFPDVVPDPVVDLHGVVAEGGSLCGDRGGDPGVFGFGEVFCCGRDR